MNSQLVNFHKAIRCFLYLLALIFSTSALCKENDVKDCKLRLQYHKELIDKSTPIISTKYSTEIKNLESLLSEVGCQLVKINVPPGRGFILMEEGELDVMIAITKNPERERMFHFIGPHGKERNWLIGPRTKKLTISNIKKLEKSKLTISATKSAFYGYEFEKLKNDDNFSKRIVLVPNNRQKLDLLIKGRVDLTVENEYVIEQMTDSGLFDEMKLSKLFLVDDSYIYYAFSRRSVSDALAAELQRRWEK
jgi:polar amino acid transport system substrate-binding protein